MDPPAPVAKRKSSEVTVDASSTVSALGTVKRAKVGTARVLSEEDYEDALETIIARDYFPLVHKLKQYQRAAATGLPASFRGTTDRAGATPLTPSLRTPGQQDNDPMGYLAATAPDPSSVPAMAAKMSLREFFQNYVSEDNASFEELQKKALEAWKRKYWWAQPKAEDQVNALGTGAASRLLTAAEDGSRVGPQLLITGSTAEPERPGAPTTWKYQPKNSLMYVPSGAVSTATAMDTSLAPPKETHAQNTRFPSGFLDDLRQRAADQRRGLAFSDDIDGVDAAAIAAGTSQLNGNGAPKSSLPLVRTPSPTPGNAGGESPFITWGDIVGTPLHLTQEDVRELKVSSNVPMFRVPAVPVRDQLVRKLTKKHPTPLRSSTGSSYTPSPSGTRPIISPAASRLLSSNRKRTDDLQLRASYASPLIPSRPGHGRTPSHPALATAGTPKGTPGAVSTRTPTASSRVRPSPMRSADGAGASSAAARHGHASDHSNRALTDGLL